ncbi:MAG TPA: tRNA epoxyqueuosine(34) reductase QueG [Candidatus Limnocylindria bacterium]
MLVRERLETIARRHGLELVGVTDASALPEDRARMEASVAAGRMGDMDWMGGSRPETATDPRRLEPDARSVIVVAAPYAGRDRQRWDPAPDALRRALTPVLEAEPQEPLGRIARYAVGGDYHDGLRRRLEELADDLCADGLPAGATAYVDDRPLAERALAARAGLGWIGKNTNLLTHQRAGSWVFLGAVLSSAELPVDQPVRTNCGSCTRCLSGCPTAALVAPQTIDARRCISYLTIEHRGVLSEWESQAIGDWIFGCDVCQEVCPVNAEAEDDGPLLVPLVPLIDWLLSQGARAFDRAVGETALTRAGRHRLLRNAIAALGNVKPMPDGSAELLDRASADRRPEVREQAAQVLAAR